MSEQQAPLPVESAQAPGPAQQKATPLQMALGCGFLIVCVAVCGGVFGWFGKGASKGIGVTREDVTTVYGPTGFAFRPAPDYRGFPVEEATSLDGAATIRLVGQRADLVYASMSTNANAFSTAQKDYHAVTFIAFLCTVVPEWRGKGPQATEWLRACMADAVKGQVQSEKMMKTGRVRFTVTPNPVTMTVSFESKDW